MNVPIKILSLFPWILVGCGNDSPRPPLVQHPLPHRATACLAGKDAQLRPVHFQEVARTQESDSVWFGTPVGILVWPDGGVSVYDVSRRGVLELNEKLVYVRSFGETGEGPGELKETNWASAKSLVDAGSNQWIRRDSQGNLVLYDTRRVQRFTRDGVYLNTLINSSESFYHNRVHRILIHGNAVYHGQEGYGHWTSSMTETPTWTFRKTWADSSEDLIQWTLVERPIRADGFYITTNEQARPLVTGQGDCAVVTRGDKREAILLDLATGAQDTITLNIPWHAPVPYSKHYAELWTQHRMERNLGSGPPPPPTNTWQVRDMRLDPNGVLWLQTTPEGAIPGGIEVVRIALGSNRQITDTLPFFPQAFGGQGEIFAFRETAEGAPILVKYDRATGSAEP